MVPCCACLLEWFLAVLAMLSRDYSSYRRASFITANARWCLCCVFFVLLSGGTRGQVQWIPGIGQRRITTMVEGRLLATTAGSGGDRGMSLNGRGWVPIRLERVNGVELWVGTAEVTNWSLSRSSRGSLPGGADHRTWCRYCRRVLFFSPRIFIPGICEIISK